MLTDGAGLYLLVRTNGRKLWRLIAPPGWHHALYSASKFAVAALSQGMRDEIGGGPITVSTIYPGLIRINITANFQALRPEGGVEPDLPEGLDLTDALSPDDAAEIILTAAAAGWRTSSLTLRRPRSCTSNTASGSRPASQDRRKSFRN